MLIRKKVMQINFQGFSWDISPNSNLITLSNILESMSNNKENNQNKLIFTLKKNDLWHGVIISIKDMKKYSKLINKDGVHALEIQNLDKDEKMADFNFFIFDEKKKRGLYQYYHHSCSLMSFNNIVKKYFTKYREKLKEKKMKEYSNQNLSKYKMRKNISKLGLNSLIFKSYILEKEKTFFERMASISYLSKASFEFDIISVNDTFFSPISTKIKRARYDLSFDKKLFNKNLIQNLIDIIKEKKLKNAKVNGIDEDGNEIAYKLLNDFTSFETIDYDDYAEKFDLNNIEQSLINNKILVHLKNTYFKLKKIFI